MLALDSGGFFQLLWGNSGLCTPPLAHMNVIIYTNAPVVMLYFPLNTITAWHLVASTYYNLIYSIQDIR